MNDDRDTNDRKLSGAEALLLETLGLPFLSFVLNAEETAISERLTSGALLSNRQEATIGALVTFLGRIPRTDPFSIGFALADLGRHQPSLGMSWATAARQNSGGSIDLPVRRDPLSASLLSFVRDLYPLFLLPPPPEPLAFRGVDVTSPLFGHPEKSEFDAAVMADSALSKLFPDETEHQGRHGYFYRSTGGGRSIQLSMFAETVLQNAWRLSQFRHGRPTPSQFADEALGIIEFGRKALDSKPLTIPALIGIAGLRLPEGRAIDLPWGRLREATSADQRFVPPGLAGQLSTTDASGTSVTIDYAGDAVMEYDVPYAVQLGPWDPTESDRPMDLVSMDTAERRLETLRLALLLSTEREHRPIVVGTWRVFLDPLEVGRSTSWQDPRRGPALLAAALTEAEAQSWAEWIGRVHDHRVKSVDVAIRRTLLAAADRPDPTDALVDAVIVWENLVGSRQGEPTLRIGAAVAWLLGTDGPQRREIRRQVSKLYNLRSDVVHGNRFLKPREAFDHYREALDLTVQILRTLFRYRPELLAECKDSDDRSLRLILDGESEQQCDG
jgi:Apea-like HEPN